MNSGLQLVRSHLAPDGKIVWTPEFLALRQKFFASTITRMTLVEDLLQLVEQHYNPRERRSAVVTLGLYHKPLEITHSEEATGRLARVAFALSVSVEGERQIRSTIAGMLLLCFKTSSARQATDLLFPKGTS